MFTIISDGGCDFSSNEVREYGVEVIPFYISFDQENYLKEGIDITKEEYFNRLQKEKDLFPKTSQPNPNDYIELYRPHLEAGKDILSLTISSKLSGSHNSASIAIETLLEDFPERTIKLIDSKNVSIGQGVILKEICRMRKAGYSLEKTAETAEKVIDTTRTYFTLDTLEYLKKGGRVGPTTALVGGILGLRPILQIENGEVSQLDSVRGKKKAMKLIEQAIVHALKENISKVNVCVGHICNKEEADAFKTNIENDLDFMITNQVAEIGATIGTHAGPGAIAFTYCRHFEAIELGDDVHDIRTAAIA